MLPTMVEGRDTNAPAGSAAWTTDPSGKPEPVKTTSTTSPWKPVPGDTPTSWGGGAPALKVRAFDSWRLPLRTTMVWLQLTAPQTGTTSWST
jgi:hypothetical protein